jgi:hypothetical protein
MKKIFVFAVLAAMFCIGYSQDGNLKSKVYFRFGYSVPGWKYAGNDGKSDWNDGTKRVGGSFEVGHIYMINALKIAPGMRIGINVDYLSLAFNRFKFQDQNQNFVFAGSKIGPSFSYSPVKHLVFDAYFKFNPVWSAAAFIPSNIDNVDDRFYLGYMGLKYSAGLNVRYSLLIVGVEINPGIARNMKLWDNNNNNFSDVYLDNVNDNSHKFSVPAMNITIGMNF